MLASCSSDAPDPVPGRVPEPMPMTGLEGNTLTVELTGAGLPDGIAPDRVTVDVTGFDWQIIATIEAPVVDGCAILLLPKSFAPEELQRPDRREDMGGRWPAEASDYSAGVAALGDILAWQGDAKVGRFYVSDWDGTGNTNNKSFIYYHYTDRPYTVSGSKSGFIYEASFETGWNAYANINPSAPGSSNGILCTADIPSDIPLAWRFESW